MRMDYLFILSTIYWACSSITFPPFVITQQKDDEYNDLSVIAPTSPAASISSENNTDADWEIVEKETVKIEPVEYEDIEIAKKTLIEILCQTEVFKDIDCFDQHRIIHESNDATQILGVFEYARELVWTRLSRAEPNFGKSYDEGLRENFSRFAGFNPRKVYERLGLSKEVGIKMSSADFQLLIEQRLQSEEKEEEKWFLRQSRHELGNDSNKQVYDQYIQGGRAAVARLQVDQRTTQALHDIFAKIITEKAKLDEYRQRVQKEAASNEVNGSPSQTRQ